MAIGTFVTLLYIIVIALLVIYIILIGKRKKVIIERILNNNYEYSQKENNKSKFVDFIDRFTYSKIFKRVYPDKLSPQYKKIDTKLIKIRYIGGVTPENIFFLKLALPVIFAISHIVWKSMGFTVNLISFYVPSIANTLNSIGIPLKLPTILPQLGFSHAYILWCLGFAYIGHLIPEEYLDYKIRQRNKAIQRELPVFELFLVRMLEFEAHTIYEILTILEKTTSFFKPYIKGCLNEFYADPIKAINNLDRRIDDTEFSIVCQCLKQGVEIDKKETAIFMRDHLEQIKQMQNLHREASILKKPIYFTFLFGLPVFSIIIVQIYPWFVRAVNMISNSVK